MHGTMNVKFSDSSAPVQEHNRRCHLSILATVWEQCTCTNTGHFTVSFYLSGNMIQVTGIISVLSRPVTVRRLIVQNLADSLTTLN
jgi:hypothetical protein